MYKNKIYIIGGYNGNTQNHLNDVHVYDPSKYNLHSELIYFVVKPNVLKVFADIFNL